MSTYNHLLSLLKKPVTRFELILASILVFPLLLASIVSAATTISTNITTEGVLTVSGTASSTFVGAVGVGTTSPFQMLGVAGSIDIDNASNYMQGGKSILYASSTLFNFFGGEDAGKNLKTAVANGTTNTALGYQALFTATSSQGETAIGYKAMYSSIICGNITCGNTAVGREAMFSNTTGQFNTALGYKALNTNTTGYENVATGLRAMNLNTTGSDNTAYGFQTMYNNTSGTTNTALGGKALYSNTISSKNTAVGWASLLSSTGTSSTAVGYYSLRSQTTGSNNTALGSEAGYNITTASSSIIIGAHVNAPSATLDGQLNIGNVIYGTGMYQGDVVSSEPTTSGRIGIGTTTPYSTFHVTSGASATTTASFGEVGLATSKACYNTKNNTGADISFYFVGTTMVVESNLCR